MDTPSIELHDPIHESKSYPTSCICPTSVYAEEPIEDLLDILLLHPYPTIFYTEDLILIRDLYTSSLGSVGDSIFKKIPKEDREVCRLHLDLYMSRDIERDFDMFLVALI